MRDKVLVVDDMEINREVLTEILQDEYTVITAEDGESAVKILKEQQDEIMVLLLDLLLPGIDGFQVLEIMRAGAV